MYMGRSGFGDVQPPPAGIAPGTPCYDSSHDAGEQHCRSLSNVLLDAIPFMAPAGGGTTTCSAAELACIQTLLPAALNNSPTTDPCSQAIGVSCATLGVFAALGLAAVVVLSIALKR